MQTVEYLNVVFDGPPTGQQLTEQFGSEGWVLRFMLPIMMPPEEEGGQPQQKLGAYFTRPASVIQLPGSGGANRDFSKVG